MGRRDSVARRTGERRALIIVPLVVEIIAVVPGADLVVVGHLRRLACPESTYCSSPIAKTPVLSGKLPPLGLLVCELGEFLGIGAAVEDAPEDGYAVRHLRASASATDRERIVGSAPGQIRARKYWPAHHRVQKIGAVWADDKFLVEALLANLDVELVGEFLLVPQFPQPYGDVGLDAGRGLQDPGDSRR